MKCGKGVDELTPAAESPPRVVVQQAQPLVASLSDFATGATEQNVVYLGNRLMYDRDVEEMDPVRNAKVFAQLLLQMALFVLGPFLLAVALGFVGAILWVLTQIVDNPLTSGLSALVGVLSVLAFLVTAVCFVIAWFRSVPIRNAEWIMYLDDKGQAAPAVFAHVVGAFQRRRTPADTVRVKRVQLPGGGERDMLEVRYGVFVGYVSAYAFGNDLHVGWVYYWRLSMVRLFFLEIGNLLNGLRGRQTEVHVLARYEPAKTMREALHAAAREGVDVAGSGVPSMMGMPADVPVDAVAGLAPDGNGMFA
jgi:hypothetical protein